MARKRYKPEEIVAKDRQAPSNQLTLLLDRVSML
jgi:hypothetical protein